MPQFSARGDAGAAKPAAPSSHNPLGAPAPQAAVLTAAQAVDAAFQRFDADANGVISAEEWLIEVDPGGRFPDLVTHLAAALSLVDGNADGGISREELTAAVTAVDSDGDGSLSRSELNQARHDDSPVTALLDAHPVHGLPSGNRQGDEDEGRTVSELVDQLFSLDGNGDGLISLAELLMLADGSGPTGTPGGTADTAADGGLRVVIDAGKAPPQGGPGGGPIDFTALLPELFARLDANQDAQLSRDEINTALNALDSNQDGRIDLADQPLATWDQQSIELIGLLIHDSFHGDHAPG